MTSGGGVLIAGCGYVGTALGVALAADGVAVWGLRRRTEGLPTAIQPVSADLYDCRSLDGLPEGLRAIVYAASPGGRDEQSYADAYVRGLENVIEASVSRGERPERLVLVSSTSVYAQDDGSWVDEGSPAEPAEGTGRRILEGERLVASAPFTGVTLRLAGIYGPGRTRLLEQVRSGEARIPRDEPRYTNRIHRDDCAGAIVHLLALATPDALYLGVDREPAPIADVQRWLAAELGVPAPPAEADPENVQDSPSARRNRSNKRCKNDRLIASGYVFRYPTFREGYRAILRS